MGETHSQCIITAIIVLENIRESLEANNMMEQGFAKHTMTRSVNSVIFSISGWNCYWIVPLAVHTVDILSVWEWCSKQIIMTTDSWLQRGKWREDTMSVDCKSVFLAPIEKELNGPQRNSLSFHFTFFLHFSHLTDAFVQSDVQGREYSSYEQ